MLFSKEERGVFSGIFKVSLESIKEFRKTVNNHMNDVFSLNIPVLFVLGSKDKMIPMDINKKVYDKLKNKYKELVVVEDGHHWLCNSSKKDIVCEKIYSFLK
jgi:esterase/lipase